MRCPTCDYRLWNIASRNCPECGQPFLPSDFEFVHNSVQFCCPHCDQPYYGTGERGHLVPDEFDCVNCNQHIHMDQMILRPAADVTEKQTQVDQNPWLDRKDIGFFKAWFSMIGWATTNPTRLARATRPNSSIASAIWYLLLTSFIYSAVGMGFVSIFPLVVFSFVGPGTGGPPVIGFIFGILGGLLLSPLAILIATSIWTLITHFMLLITGRTEQNLAHTFRCMSYSYGANVISATPCLGFHFSFFSWIWWVISAIFMLRESHKVHGGRATFAVLSFPCLCFLGLFGLVTYDVYTTTSAISRVTASSNSTFSVLQETQTVADGMMLYATANNNQLPGHAFGFVVDEYIGCYEFTNASSSNTITSQIPIGNSNLEQAGQFTRRAKLYLAQDAATVLPKDVVAHRLGDFVFTYHGIDLNADDPKLWLVIQNDDPDINPYSSQIKPNYLIPISIVQADGKVISINNVDFPSALADQNQLRAQYNLAPLPSPEQVTHDQPAAAD